MEYILTPHSRGIPPYVWWEGAFTEQELNVLQLQAKNSKQHARIGGGVSNSEIRRSQVSWIHNTNETVWVFRKLAQIVSKLNSDCFGFDLTGFGEGLQLTNYDESENGMYGWHVDYGGMISRKLSLVLQLTDPSEYEGGNLQLHTGQNPISVKKQRGLIALFPSYVVHQVTPVTQGSRQSLVAWISGPSFK